MRHQDDRPKNWQQWLRDGGVGDAVGREVNIIFRALRRAPERMWAFAYGGALAGSLLATLAVGARIGERRLALMALGIAMAVSLSWWIVYRLMHWARLRPLASALTGSEALDEDPIVERIMTAVAEGLAGSNLRPRDDQVGLEELTQATIVTGLREAPTSELERHLLERLVGSSFVPTADGSVFVFRLGPNCTRCEARTRTGPLRLLNVPGYWAAENGFQRFRELPTRSQHLRAVPRREQDLARFLAKSPADIGPTSFFGPGTEIALCERCAKEALELGVLQERVARSKPPSI
jgi:hypothetical protein